MPYINIKVTDEGVTSEQKQALIKGATKLALSKSLSCAGKHRHRQLKKPKLPII